LKWFIFGNYFKVKIQLLSKLEIAKMFFPWYKFCCNSESDASMTWRQHRLKFLKSMRDDLETRLAALNAAIETIERQEERT
jgi:hypothetical protein